MEDKINLTEEQERMWKKLSEPYVPPFNGYGNAYASYAPPIAFKTRYGYNVVRKDNPGIIIAGCSA